ncbi:hypothetical protein BC830DRAFT_1229132 [Chytriomyces sp. MP71]|nr:hypothetical protein BC830DRAFT_1229132 [Chytriomyces sp. MP71]
MKLETTLFVTLTTFALAAPAPEVRHSLRKSHSRPDFSHPHAGADPARIKADNATLTIKDSACLWVTTLSTPTAKHVKRRLFAVTWQGRSQALPFPEFRNVTFHNDDAYTPESCAALFNTIHSVASEHHAPDKQIWLGFEQILACKVLLPLRPLTIRRKLSHKLLQYHDQGTQSELHESHHAQGYGNEAAAEERDLMGAHCK